jgi:hypothetical protein
MRHDDHEQDPMPEEAVRAIALLASAIVSCGKAGAGEYVLERAVVFERWITSGKVAGVQPFVGEKS